MQIVGNPYSPGPNPAPPSYGAMLGRPVSTVVGGFPVSSGCAGFPYVSSLVFGTAGFLLIFCFLYYSFFVLFLSLKIMNIFVD
jgi:hypothetical protein